MIATVLKRPVPGARAKQYGNNATGALEYLFGPGRAEEHTDPHLVGAWHGADLEDIEPPRFVRADGTERVSVKGLGSLLTEPVIDRDAPHVYHVAVATKAGDRVLSDAEWGQVAADLMDRTGIAPAGDDAGCRWVAVRHGQSAGGNDHIHILATLTRQDGRRVSPRHDFAALRIGCQEWEQHLGLTMTAASDRTAAWATRAVEQRAAERRGQTVPDRDRLRQTVAAVAAVSTSQSEFLSGLEVENLTVKLRYSTVNEGQVTGYAVGLPGHVDRAGEQIYYSGSKLAPDLSWRRLEDRWADTFTGTGSVDRACDVLARGRLLMARDQSGSAVESAAWAAGDWAQAAARVTGNPDVRAAADRLAVAGRPGRQRGTDGAAAMRMRSSARMLAGLVTSGGTADSAQTRRLVAEMMLLASALADLRRAQGQPLRAAAADQAHQQLIGADARRRASERQTPAAGRTADSGGLHGPTTSPHQKGPRL